MTPSAYLDALRMLARRELSESQIRQRLARKGHGTDAVDDAVVRLRDQRAIDDERVAHAMARTAVSVRGHGRARVRRDIQHSGIAPVLANRAIDEAFESIDDDALLQAALDRRLRGRLHLDDDAEFRRLYRYLVGQGFDSDRVVRLLKTRSVE